MEDTKGLSERLLSSNHLLCCSHYGISIQTVFFHELCRSTTLAEAVVYGYEFLRHGVVGYQSLSNALAKPPKRLCSSAVTTHPVLETEARIAFSSNGLIVAMPITSALTPAVSSASAACKASHTRWPVAMIVTSVPSVNTSPFPISNLASAGVKFATLGRPNRK